MSEKKGKKVLDIACRRVDAGVEITLTDSGPGIPPDLCDKIFQPFVTCGKTHGTGLGLAIARSIVEAHGGRIDLASEVGKGATFTVTVPLEVSSE